ncbi:SPOR domain-containing protein [Rhizobium sp. S152]|uniref:SPOR domain-containing protein n=1 Tax=Rhizobium sp. S152 TaxID=3055038 RepID=UPI0025AA126D|nr:SPOR domain-containing protein [Rhizobium sp. S152]MDM9629570.1 SPOR domain-containing protein [Rhizobium sp. S152]
MADKQRAYDTRKNTDLFADDDPLAELARIVGFEPRVAANTVADVQPPEPAFNLEDELLREFEQYEAPQQAASYSHPAEPVFEQPIAYEEPAYEAAPAPQAAYEQSYEAAPEIQVAPEADFASEEALAAAIAPHSGTHHLLASADWTSSVSRAAEPVSGGARDLIEELEQSIGAAPAPVAPVQPAKAPQWSAASIRLPLANFHPASRQAPVPTVVEPAPVVAAAPQPISAPEAVSFAPEVPAYEAPVAAGFPAEIDRHEEPVSHEEPPVEEEPFVFDDAPVAETFVDHSAFDLAAAAKDGDIQTDAALTEAAPADLDDIAFDLDDLLADVSQYPVPDRQSAPKADAFEPALSPELVREVAAAPVAVAPTPAPYQPPVAASVAANVEPEAEDPFAGHDFELDLEGIELELADLDFAEPVNVQAVETPAPQPVAPVASYRPEPAPVPRPAPVVAAAPVYQQPMQTQFSASPAYQPQPKAPVASAFASDAGDELPFDPSMISDAEYHPETVEDMHVPVLPPVEQPVVHAPTSDFDFDVDAEIASLLAPSKPVAAAAVKPAAEEWRGRAPVTVAPMAPAPKPPQAQNFDEFERALEEDFRRSVSEPVQARSESVSQVQIQSASDAEDMSRARSMKRMLAAAAMIVVFGGVAYAGYSFLARDGGLGISSGEPRVIVAEKDPVKVVPENPGGKTVPNQDKAVYDSVGGAASAAPKQKALVSSDEQPVDVVQRTLTPETMPEDNDMAMPSMATPVGDTEDPRLLPTQDTADAADDADDANKPAVSARKVRTMIVKPDGTLVAREDVAPEAAPTNMPVTKTVQTQKITPNGSAASFPAAGQVASADIRSTPVEKTSPTAAQAPSENVLAKAAAATPADVDPPVRSVQSSTVSDTAPVPGARPLSQQAKPAEAAPAATAPAKPTEVASAPQAAAQPQPTTAAAGSYGMQIASLPSEEEAKKSYASLSKKFAGVLGGRAYEIRKADIAGKGTFYRVRIPAGSKDEAAALCEKFRSAGGSCLISK